MTATYQYSIDRHRIVRHKFNNSPNGRGYYYEEIIIPQQILLPWYQQPGLVISVVKDVIIDHYGIVTDKIINGAPTVISNSRAAGGVVEQPWAIFTQEQTVTVRWGATVGYAPTIIYRARKRLGLPYNVFSSNCEHFVRDVYGLLVESPQLRKVGILATIAGVGLLLYAAANEE